MNKIFLIIVGLLTSQPLFAAEFSLADFVGRVVIVDQKDAVVVGRIESEVDQLNPLQLIASADFEVRGRPFKENCDISLTKQADARAAQFLKARCMAGQHPKDIWVELPTNEKDYESFKNGSFMTGHISIRDSASGGPMVIRLPVDVMNLDASPRVMDLSND